MELWLRLVVEMAVLVTPFAWLGYLARRGRNARVRVGARVGLVVLSLATLGVIWLVYEILRNFQLSPM